MSFDKKNSDMSNNTIDLKSRQDDKELISDDMNIKLHLNESLDLKGITVSEDLINKTLSAIKQSETEQQDQQQDNKSNDEMASKKIIPWNRYIRKIAGVAAAVLIVTVGLSLTIKDSLKNDNMQKNAETAPLEETSLYGTADASCATDFEAEQSSEDESDQSFAKDETDTSTAPESAGSGLAAALAPEEDTVFTEIGESKVQAKEGTEGEDNITAAITDSVDDQNGSQKTITGLTDDLGNTEQPQITSSVKSTNGQEYITFEEIILTKPELAKTVKIIDQTNNTEIVLTEQSDILNFYSVMEQQLFIIGTTVPSSPNYIVEVVGLQTEDVLYTIMIGDSISVSNATGDTADQNIYNTENNALLIQNLDEFYQSYNQ